MSKSIEELPKFMQDAIDNLCECVYQSDKAYGMGNDNTKKIKMYIAELTIMNAELRDNAK